MQRLPTHLHLEKRDKKEKKYVEINNSSHLRNTMLTKTGEQIKNISNFSHLNQLDCWSWSGQLLVSMILCAMQLQMALPGLKLLLSFLMAKFLLCENVNA